MVNNYFCEKCSKAEVCKIADIINKFGDEAKKQLGVDITMDNCYNYEISEDFKTSGEDEN